MAYDQDIMRWGLTSEQDAGSAGSALIGRAGYRMHDIRQHASCAWRRVGIASGVSADERRK